MNLRQLKKLFGTRLISYNNLDFIGNKIACVLNLERESAPVEKELDERTSGLFPCKAYELGFSIDDIKGYQHDIIGYLSPVGLQYAIVPRKYLKLYGGRELVIRMHHCDSSITWLTHDCPASEQVEFIISARTIKQPDFKELFIQNIRNKNNGFNPSYESLYGGD